MTSRIISLNSNAAQPGINQKGVKGLPILLADNSPLLRFDGVIEPILTELFNLTKKNRILHRTRDLLLPRLISGELDISDLEIKTANENDK
ncbi:hypothetical protein IIA29_10280 [candidate division KSB1 bacterium]|nr:hypothetical protein [candidate division KSB1 bacterium]